MEAVVMPRKKSQQSKASLGETRQIGIRFPVVVLNRIEECGDRLGLDISSLIRLIVNEKMPEYEDRARKTVPDQD